MNFDRASDPKPLPAKVAVRRGTLLVNGPVWLIMTACFGLAYVFGDTLPVLGLALAVVAIPCAWLWWSLYIPQWRRWALHSGADPVELQHLGEAAGLVWPRGSLFEKTEIHRRDA
jgi:hypothetical protein